MSRYKQEPLLQTCSENIYCKHIFNDKQQVLVYMLQNARLTCANINCLTDRISSAWTSTSWSAFGRLVNHAAFAAPSCQHLHWFFSLLSWTCGRTYYHDTFDRHVRTAPCDDQLGTWCTSSNMHFHLLQHSWQQRIDTSHKKSFPNNGRPRCGQEGPWHS